VEARKAVVLALAALLLLAGAAAAIARSVGSTGTSYAVGPLGGPADGGGICYRFRPGQTFTDAEITDINHSSAPATITSAWLTGRRDMTVDAVYADAFTAGSLGPASNADWYGWPPASLRHPASSGVLVPAGMAVTVLFVVTATSSAAFFGGQDVAYSSQGQSYTQANPRFLGPGPDCPE
jgi:hypothetical protein